mgnify:CR=1 FL=1|jgi:ribonucleoside-diphosphate reductase alpha chain
MDNYQQYIALSRYARYLDDKGRRETFEETADRYINFFKERHSGDNEILSKLSEAREAIVNMEVMPSMRCMMTAGAALDRDNVAGYNCSYLPIDHIRAFDETLYILMCGTGVGYSVERQYTNKLPDVAESFHPSDTVIVVSDSKIGWASAFRELVSLLYAGKLPNWDMSRIRQAGARLKTFGGRASGPAPLEDLFRFAVDIFKGAAGRKLNSLEVHDLVCKIADVVVVGGVRRAALICLSNLTDQRMRHAKDGQFWESAPHRALANNSVSYTERPDVEIFMEEWLALYRSKSGERGIFNRQAADFQAAKNERRELGYEWGTNPCSEIILRPNQFCNLTEVVVRATDTTEDLLRKAKIASFLGTLQSTLIDFRYLRKVWEVNTKEERLLGVSLTGILDHPNMRKITDKNLPLLLEELKTAAVQENKKVADHLAITQSAAVTCVKPSGTVSQLVNSASGIHARHAPYYLRRVRGDKKDPLTQFMIEAGVPSEDDLFNPSAVVFSFPQKAPSKSFTMSALEHLKLWKIYQDHWCEHKPSVTINYKDSEYVEIGNWVWNNFNEISGVSFLPSSDHVYQQAPYEEITAEEYKNLKAGMPDVNFTNFNEEVDNTVSSQELACVAGACEI